MANNNEEEDGLNALFQHVDVQILNSFLHEKEPHLYILQEITQYQGTLESVAQQVLQKCNELFYNCKTENDAQRVPLLIQICNVFAIRDMVLLQQLVVSMNFAVHVVQNYFVNVLEFLTNYNVQSSDSAFWIKTAISICDKLLLKNASTQEMSKAIEFYCTIAANEASDADEQVWGEVAQTYVKLMQVGKQVAKASLKPFSDHLYSKPFGEVSVESIVKQWYAYACQEDGELFVRKICQYSEYCYVVTDVVVTIVEERIGKENKNTYELAALMLFVKYYKECMYHASMLIRQYNASYQDNVFLIDSMSKMVRTVHDVIPKEDLELFMRHTIHLVQPNQDEILTTSIV